MSFPDEPTNRIDETAKKSLQEAIRVYPGTVSLISREADSYEEIVDRVIDIEGLVK